MPPQDIIEKAIQRGLPVDRAVWYKNVYNVCGKHPCRCHTGMKHGPYWLAYFRVDGVVETFYVGKENSGKQKSIEIQ